MNLEISPREGFETIRTSGFGKDELMSHKNAFCGVQHFVRVRFFALGTRACGRCLDGPQSGGSQQEGGAHCAVDELFMLTQDVPNGKIAR